MIGKYGTPESDDRIGPGVCVTLELCRLTDCWEMSVRLRNALYTHHLDHVGDVVRWSAKELLTIRNFGKKSLGELLSILREENAPPLGTKIEGWPPPFLHELAKRASERFFL